MDDKYILMLGELRGEVQGLNKRIERLAASQEQLVSQHEKRISALEHIRTRLTAIAVLAPAAIVLATEKGGEALTALLKKVPLL